MERHYLSVPQWHSSHVVVYCPSAPRTDSLFSTVSSMDAVSEQHLDLFKVPTTLAVVVGPLLSSP